MKITCIAILMLLISVFSTMADELWTTFRSPPPASGCLAVDGKYIWCGTDYGAFRYDSVTGDMSHYTVDDGLIDNTVNAIAPGPDGVIWFATNIGISRFDGSSWKSFTRNDIISAIFYDITVDSDNTVWVASSGGIVTFNGEEWRLIEKGAFSCINAGSNGVVWAGSSRAKLSNYLLRIEGSDVIRIGDNIPEINADKFKDIAVAPGDSLVWFPSDSTIVSYNDMGKTVFEYPDSLGSFDVIDVDKNGTVWFADQSRLVSYHNGKTEQYKDIKGSFDGIVKDLVCGKNGVVWISTEYSLLSFDGKEFRSHTKFYSAGPVYNIITDIAIDRNNVKWVNQFESSSPYGTVSTYDDTMWREIPELSGIDYIIIAIDPENVVWLASGGTLFSFKDDKRTTFFAAGMDYINDLLFDDGLMWIADGGDFNYPPDVITYDGVNFNFIIKSLQIRKLAMDSHHDIWMAGHGLYRYDGSVLHEYTSYDGTYHGYGNIAVDYDDVIWLSVYSNDGGYNFASYNNGDWTLYTPENSGLASNKIWGDIVVDRNNVKWISTKDAGVCRFDCETWTTFNTSNSGLCDNKVNTIAVEKNNTIWFGTDNGVSRYTGEMITTSVDENETKPETLPVIRSYPNPFNPSTTIEFTLPEAGSSTLSIYNIAGQKVRGLVSENMTAGHHTAVWDGRDDSGSSVSAGLYFARLTSGGRTVTGKMVMVK